MSRHPRHRAPRQVRKLRPLAARTLAAGLVVTLSASSAVARTTYASFTDLARARMAVSAGWASCPSRIDTSHGSVSFQNAVPGATGLIGLCSPNGVWWTYYQGDGNLVIYDTRTMTPTRTAASNGSRALTLQDDGNLVVVLADGTVHHTYTYGIPVPASLVMQDDGNLVLLDANGAVRWTSAAAAGLACPPPNSTLMCGPWG